MTESMTRVGAGLSAVSGDGNLWGTWLREILGTMTLEGITAVVLVIFSAHNIQMIGFDLREV